MFGKLNRLILSLALLCVMTQAGRAELVGHWKLDDGSGTVAADATGKGHTGTLLNSPTWADGRLGGALKFAGGTQKVDIPFSAELNPVDELTVSVWANVDPTGTSHRSPVTSRDDAPQRGYILYVEPGNTWQFWTGTGTGWHTTAGPAAVFNEWTLVTGTLSGQQRRLYINGGEVGQGTAAFSPNTAQVLRIGGGATESAGNYFFVGLVDDVRVYNHALSEPELTALMEGKPYPFAVAPKPKIGAMIDSVQVTLQWSAGEQAVSHNVYLGEDRDAVAGATPDDAALFLGSMTTNRLALGGPTSKYPTGLTPGKTYYWRVDEVNPDNPDSPWKGQIWSFWVQPATAWNPSPADGVKYINLEQDLTWSKGQGVLFHTVFLGESLETVGAATTGGFMTTDVKYDPGALKVDTTYYWRVDEFTMTATTLKGPVWSFRTMPEIAVTDPNLLARWTLDEGAGNNVVDWSGHGHHGTLGGNPQWVGGYFGGGLMFNGTADYVNFGTPADLYLPKSYSYCAWFKVGKSLFGNSGAQYLLCIGSRSDLVLGIEDLVGVNGDLSLHYYDTAPGFHAVGVNQIIWSAEDWHLVVGTRDAAGHKIYLDGELKNSDTNTNNDNYATTRMISLGARAWTSPQVAFFNGVLDEVRVYNRALTQDEVKGLLNINPLVASEPSPARDVTVDIRDVDSLSWVAGDGAVSHDVYFGADRAAVAAAGKDTPQFKGNQAGTSFPAADLVTFGGGSYFWRIDEVATDGTVRTGDVWKFTVPAYLAIEDFESYTDKTDDGAAIYQTWIDGWENKTSSTVGYLTSAGGTFGETAVVHGGGQSMPLDYNNVKSPYYSETERTWAAAEDWTAEGADTLTLYFRGRAGNKPDTLYVALKDSAGKTAVVAHPNADAALAARWTEWNIPLSAFTGVNAGRIKTMCIGLGERDAPTAGGAGLLFIDDIRLTRAQP